MTEKKNGSDPSHPRTADDEEFHRLLETSVGQRILDLLDNGLGTLVVGLSVGQVTALIRYFHNHTGAVPRFLSAGDIENFVGRMN